MKNFAKISEVKVGSLLQCNDGFTCLPKNAQRYVHEDDGELYIVCKCGKHFLDGQISFDDKEEYVGLYLLK